MDDKQRELREVATLAQSTGWEYVKKFIEKRIGVIETDLLEMEELELVERIALQKERKALKSVLQYVEKRFNKALET